MQALAGHRHLSGPELKRMLGVLVRGEAIPQAVDQHHQQFIRIPLGGHGGQFATPQALHDLQGCDMHDG